MGGSARSSRRVELSLDDSMDFSPDEDDDDDEDDVRGKATPTPAKKTSKAALKSKLATGKRVSLSDSEGYGVSSYNEDSEPRTKQQQGVTSVSQKSSLPATRATKDESERDDDDDAHRAHVSKPSAQVVITKSPKAESSSEDEDDDDDDAVASFMHESEEGDPPPFSAAISSKTAPSTTKIEPQAALSHAISKAPPISNAYSDARSDGEDEEVESIASNSDYVESFEHEHFPPTTSTKPSVAVASLALATKSGVYEEESFNEESGVTPSTAATLSSRITSVALKTPLEDSAKSEPNFDYSMDFSDDNGGGEGKSNVVNSPEPPMRVISEAEAQPARGRSSSSPSSRSDASDRSDHSEFLESDRSGDDGAKAEPVSHTEQQFYKVDDRGLSPLDASNLSELELGESATAATTAPTIRMSPDSEMRAAVDALGENLERSNVVPEAIRSRAIVENTPVVIRVEPSAGVVCDTSRTLNEPPPRSLPAAAVSATRSRVLIVREYEQPTGERAEMKDASTQFTGNHAAIQVDLTPNGMHNLVAEPSLPEKTPNNSDPQSTMQNPVQEQRSQPVDASCCAAPPPSAPILSSPGYSMDALRLPSATMTSLYKQQLLALQEQILVKKRETERLVHERMTFQYSTLRGTERVSADLRTLRQP